MTKSFFYGIFVLLVLWCFVALKVDIVPLFEGLPNLFILLGDAFPPDETILVTALKAILETLQIAFLGTLFGMVLALPLAILSSRNIYPKWVVIPIRILLATLRTMPSLLWAIVFVIMIGFGPFAGVLATTMYTIGYLGKLQYEAIEGLDPEPLEAISSTGAAKIQLIRFVVLPESANHLLSQLLFMFEYNVRSSTILGFVGAGGIGFYIQSYLRFLEYDKVITFLLVTLFTVLVIDYASVRLRDRFLTDKSAIAKSL